MIIIMKKNSTSQQLKHVVNWVESNGYNTHVSHGEERTIVGVIGDERPLDRSQAERIDGVERAITILAPYKLASLDVQPEQTRVPLNGLSVGEDQVALIAGPCSVESREQILETAHAVKEAGATALRGGAFKPRSSPYSFQILSMPS